MKNLTFGIVTILLIMAAIVGYVSFIPPRMDNAAQFQVSKFPTKIGDWQSKEVTLSERVYEILETRNLFVREYTNSKKDKVYLYIVYSEDNRKVSHPPEVCLMGSGETITEKKVIDILSNIRANQLTVERGEDRQMVVYWYKAGPAYTDKYLKQQFKVVMDRLFGKRTAGALIRLSVDIKGEDKESALKTIRSFAALIQPLLPQYAP